MAAFSGPAECGCPIELKQAATHMHCINRSQTAGLRLKLSTLLDGVKLTQSLDLPTKDEGTEFLYIVAKRMWVFK